MIEYDSVTGKTLHWIKRSPVVLPTIPSSAHQQQHPLFAAQNHDAAAASANQRQRTHARTQISNPASTLAHLRHPRLFPPK
jgi:hypothetical protein